MLRRLARRLSTETENSGDTNGNNGGLDGKVALPGSGAGDKWTNSAADAEFDAEDGEDEVERWVMDAGRASGSVGGGVTGDAREAGRKVWVPDKEDVWRIARIIQESTDGSSYVVEARDGRGEDQVAKQDCADYDPSHALNLADAARMNQIHEAPLLDLLNRRFHEDLIYTHVAEVLVSINPYKTIPGLYDIPMPELPKLPPRERLHLPKTEAARKPAPGGRVAEATAALMRTYSNNSDKGAEKRTSPPGNANIRKGMPKDKSPQKKSPKEKLDELKTLLGRPHVYGVADRAFQYMTETKGREVHGRVRRRDQSILITGESGAGKTEASKHVMRFLITASRALAGGPDRAGSKGVKATSLAAKHMEDVLLRSNTVLEAFGNAKTVRNDNSSRFGKYIKLQYDEAFRLVGAKTEHFLLERSRLVHLEYQERSFHILYQVAKALPEKMKEELGLTGGPEVFSLINQGDCLDASDDVDDREEFDAVDKALSSLDFTTEEKKDMWRLLAAILHSGEVRFDDLGGNEDGCRMADSADTYVLSPSKLASLWGVEEEVLQQGVTRRTVHAGGSSASIALNAAQAKENLLALLKHTYRQLFAWINWKINVVFDIPGGTTPSGEKTLGKTFIGILDIFGFEIMATNSFEQLCINYANEVLQQQFNHHVFVLEQEEYAAEGLDVASIPFRDNQHIIDLISKRPSGLMPILEDQALTGRQAASLRSSFTDKNLLDLFHQEHHRRAPHPSYRKPRIGGPEFVILHYAGDVTYCATGFLEKNNDTLQEDLRGLLLSSKIAFHRQLMMGQGGSFSANGSSKAPGSMSNGSISNSTPSKGVRPNGHPMVGSKNYASEYINGLKRGPSGDRPGRDAPRGMNSARIAAKTTVSNTFRRQLEDLVAQLGETEPHYIKCIKPNSSKSPGGWSSQLVIEQLRYSGVLEVVRIRREAFPMRVTYKQFYRRFGDLVNGAGRRMPSADSISREQARETGLEICEKAFGKEAKGSAFQLGKTKIFLRDDGLERLRASLRQHRYQMARRIQAAWRGASVRAQLAREHAAAARIQSIARDRVSRIRYKSMRTAAISLQAFVRMRYASLIYRKKVESSVRIQALWRGWRQRNQRSRLESVVKIQAIARGHLVKKHTSARVEAAKTLQVPMAAISRGMMARKRFADARRRVTLLQAMARGRLARKELEQDSKNVILAQALWRGKMCRMRRHHEENAATRIKATWRGSRDRQKLRVQAAARGFIERTRAAERTDAASRIQQAIKVFQRNGHLAAMIKALFAAARRGDAADVARSISQWPQLLFVRDRYEKHEGEDGKLKPTYATLLHAACQSGATDVAALLEPFPCDVMARDNLGNSSIHVAAGACEYELLKFLARRANLDVDKAVRCAHEGKPSPEPEVIPFGISKEAFATAAGLIRRLRISKAMGGPAMATATPGTCPAPPGGMAPVHGGFDTSVASGPRERGWTGTLSGEAGAGGRPVMQGMLKKRRETDRWMKRWCELKQYQAGSRKDQAGPALFYYKKKADRTPSKVIMLHHCLLKKSEHVDFAFELHSPVLMEGRNNEGRLYFQAADEVDLQRWMVPLRVLVKFYDFKNEKRKSPMEFLDLERRNQLVQAANKHGQTPLHLASVFHGGKGVSDDGPGAITAALRAGTWLVENGADPNAYDADGDTTLHAAVKGGNCKVAGELEIRGGDTGLKDKGGHGKSVADLVAALEEPLRGDTSWTPGLSSSSGTDVNPLRSPPVKLFGFTYVSIFLEKLSLPTTVGLTSPVLTVSVFNAKAKLSEVAQDVVSPAITFPNFLWWARTWHMRTPLETLGAGSAVVFELRDLKATGREGVGGSKGRAPVSCWGCLPLNQDELNTQPEVVTFYSPPMDLKSLSKEGKHGIAAGLGMPLEAGLLAADVALTRALE